MLISNTLWLSFASLVLVTGAMFATFAVRPIIPRKFAFRIAYTNVSSSTALDGVQSRLVLTANNQFPGPTIDVFRGEWVEVTVYNALNVSTTLHFHGLYQMGTPLMDGALGATQCGIGPGKTFTYRFTVGEQSGTFWWHAHAGVQYADGLYGALIVRDQSDVHSSLYDEERIIILSDWYHQYYQLLVPDYLAANSSGLEPLPQSGLINGVGRVSNCSLTSLPCDPNTNPAVISVTSGTRYRLRIINAAAMASFTVSIDNHTLTVIEADGIEVDPFDLDDGSGLDVNVAQRYSVVFEASQDEDIQASYWIKAIMKICRNETDPLMVETVRAVLVYDSPASEDDDLSSDSDVLLPASEITEMATGVDPTMSLKPVFSADAPAYHHQMTIAVQVQENPVTGLTRGTMNNVTYSAQLFDITRPLGGRWSPDRHSIYGIKNRKQM